jgi:Cu2+-exporting ATPase
LQLAATVESGTQHPLAVAVQTGGCRNGELQLLQAENFHTEAGLGITALVTLQGAVRSLCPRQSNDGWKSRTLLIVHQKYLEQANDCRDKQGKRPIFVALG